MRNAFNVEMARRVRPTLLKMLRDETTTGEEGARTCVCGGKSCFRRMTMQERRSNANNPVKFAPACDCCGERQYKVDERGRTLTDEEGQSVVIGTHMWSCEQKSIVHLSGIDVCDDCMSVRAPSL